MSDDDAELLIATGFLALGPKVLAEPDQMKMLMDIIDEQIDTVGKAMLGLTLSCARCHDHKFDPITMEDYYALAGIFKSTRTMESLKKVARWNENVIASADQLEMQRPFTEKVAAKKSEIEALVTKMNAQLYAQSGVEPSEDAEESYPLETRQQLKSLREDLKALEKAVPEVPSAMGVFDDQLADVRIHVRGSHLTLGKEVRRGMPAVLQTEQVEPIPESHSGRLELANWLVDSQNPLTARVMMNRLWRWHFGRGLVPTTDNFGKMGERPSNQALLDWLAAEFMEGGWSVKQMHKLIMLSRTYQMSSQLDAADAGIDVDNQHHWCARTCRLEAEEIRDALLSVSGQLDTTMGGSLLQVANRDYIFNHTSKDGTTYETCRRSLYLPVIRNNLYDEFSLFDFTEPDSSAGDRATSTIAPQALFMMNSDLLLKSSTALVERLFRECPEETARVSRLYELAFGRPATEAETARLIQFIKSLASDFERANAAGTSDESVRKAWIAACHVVLASNEFIYVE